MKQLRTIILVLLAVLSSVQINASETEGEKINIPEIVLEHLSDSYEWHIASYEGKHISIPLPIIGMYVRLIVCQNSFSLMRHIMVKSMRNFLMEPVSVLSI